VVIHYVVFLKKSEKISEKREKYILMYQACITFLFITFEQELILSWNFGTLPKIIVRMKVPVFLARDIGKTTEL